MAAGGSLVQDCAEQVPGAIKHDYFPNAGYARDYLFVGGGWRDHVLTSLVNPTWRPLPRG